MFPVSHSVFYDLETHLACVLKYDDRIALRDSVNVACYRLGLWQFAFEVWLEVLEHRRQRCGV